MPNVELQPVEYEDGKGTRWIQHPLFTSLDSPDKAQGEGVGEARVTFNRARQLISRLVIQRRGGSLTPGAHAAAFSASSQFAQQVSAGIGPGGWVVGRTPTYRVPDIEEWVEDWDRKDRARDEVEGS